MTISVRPVAIEQRESVDNRAIDSLIAWMIDGARPSASAHEIIDGICVRLIAAGVPVDRMALFIDTLHPNVAGRRLMWMPHTGTDITEGPVDLFTSDDYLKNPVPVVTSGKGAIRRHLENEKALDEYSILRELHDEGFTDYLAQPLIYTTGEIHAVTWATKAPGGFNIEAISAIELVRNPLARLVETYQLRLNASTILSTYVGRKSGDQILQGRVHRGDGEEIEAVILFADLIGFTALSNSKTGPEIVEMLNGAFDLMVPPVEAHGGEILKFMGDGFFAIFPYGEKRTLSEAVRAASQTVMEGENNLAATELGKTVMFRSALHAGRFHYGNIGGAGRLDFTAIGRPINYAARLLAAAADIESRRVASADISEHLCLAPKLVGEVEFKGFDGFQNVYAY